MKSKIDPTLTILFTIKCEIEPTDDVFKPDVFAELDFLEIDHIEVLDVRSESVVLVVDLYGLYLVLNVDVGAA